MQRSPSPTGYENAVARIITLLDRHRAHGQRHIEVGDGQDAERRVLQRKRERPGDSLGDQLGRLVALRPNTAAEKIFRIDAAGDQVSVSHGRLRAALPITSRTGYRAGALRTDFQTTPRIDPGDAAAAVADLDDIHDREHHRMTGHVSAYVIAARHLRVEVFDETGFGRGASHVE